MPLTKHLYREDEVRAALQWCILKGRVIETAFWATELIETGLGIRSDIQTVWTYGIGLAGLGWLGNLKPDLQTAIRLAVHRGRDASVVAILGSTPSRVGAPAIPPGTWTAEETFALRAMMQGKAGSVWAANWDWDLWATAMMFKHRRFLPLEGLLQDRALATAVICQTTLSIEEPTAQIPVEATAALAEWAAEPNLRHRRVFSIPTPCLSMLTKRGELDSYSSFDEELRDKRQMEAAMGVFWLGMLAKARRTDEAYEAFYDKHFGLSDIPDEWSVADRAKSHGPGLNPCDMPRFLERWFGTMPCAAIWNGVQTARLQGRGFHFVYQQAPLPPLDPVRRILSIPCAQ